MMLRPNRTHVALAVSVAGAIAAVVVAGCGGDDSTLGSQGDASVDAVTDAPSVLPDSSPDSSGDAMTPPEAGKDGGDGGVSGDASDSAPPPFYDGSAADFPARVSGAFCTAKQVCCLVSPSQWDESNCVRQALLGGGFRNLNTYGASLDGGHVILDASAAGTCLADMQALLTASCGVVTSATILRLQGECYGAFTGTLGIDAGTCATALECASGETCSPAGVCVSLSPLGGPCSSTSDCLYRGSVPTPVYCNLPTDGGVGRCAVTEGADGSVCANAVNANDVCQSGLCGFNPGCIDSTTFTDPGPHNFYCTFILPEAGSDAAPSEAGPSDGGDGGG